MFERLDPGRLGEWLAEYSLGELWEKNMLGGRPGPSAVESGPELVNEGVDTAPSKRIMNAYPQYTKTVDGPLVIADAGLDYIRSSCPHMDDWLREIETRSRLGNAMTTP